MPCIGDVADGRVGRGKGDGEGEGWQSLGKCGMGRFGFPVGLETTNNNNTSGSRRRAVLFLPTY